MVEKPPTASANASANANTNNQSTNHAEPFSPQTDGTSNNSNNSLDEDCNKQTPSGK